MQQLQRVIHSSALKVLYVAMLALIVSALLVACGGKNKSNSTSSSSSAPTTTIPTTSGGNASGGASGGVVSGGISGGSSGGVSGGIASGEASGGVSGGASGGVSGGAASGASGAAGAVGAAANAASGGNTSGGASGGAAGSGAASSGASGGGAQAVAAGFDWQTIGATTYNNCAACHQANGQGVPGAFPPLAGHLPDIYNTDGGREYLIHAVLFGLQGQISVKGQSYNGAMPGWKQLSDEQIAAVLDHELTSWGDDQQVNNFKPIQPSEVKAERSKDLTPQQVYAARQELDLGGAASGGASSGAGG